VVLVVLVVLALLAPQTKVVAVEVARTMVEFLLAQQVVRERSCFVTSQQTQMQKVCLFRLQVVVLLFRVRTQFGHLRLRVL
jgi:hypothetical protein